MALAYVSISLREIQSSTPYVYLGSYGWSVEGGIRCIDGRVLINAKNPVAGAGLYVKITQDEKVSFAYTDSQGNFGICGLNKGSVTLAIGISKEVINLP